MREIVFDTETTGLDNKVDRIIEIGCVELENQFPTGRSLHLFINPDGRAVHPDALAVHGITDQFLADKPVFADLVDEIAAFFRWRPLRRAQRQFRHGVLERRIWPHRVAARRSWTGH
jgi:DNA polymerase III epsilon subunit family exonuclease